MRYVTKHWLFDEPEQQAVVLDMTRMESKEYDGAVLCYCRSMSDAERVAVALNVWNAAAPVFRQAYGI